MSRYYLPGTPTYFYNKNKNKPQDPVVWNEPNVPLDPAHPGASDGSGVAIPNYDPEILEQLQEEYPDEFPSNYETPDNYDSSYDVGWNKLYLELGLGGVALLLIVATVDKVL